MLTLDTDLPDGAAVDGRADMQVEGGCISEVVQPVVLPVPPTAARPLGGHTAAVLAELAAARPSGARTTRVVDGATVYGRVAGGRVSEVVAPSRAPVAGVAVFAAGRGWGAGATC
jgi:hypothetical protein